MNAYALDFDGVLCDSAGETGATGWRAAALIWPGEFPEPPPADYLARFARVRPVLETGFESILIARLLADGVSEAELLARFPALAAPLLARPECARATLIARFGGVRDTWIRTRFADWLALHRFYPGTVATVQRWQAAGAPVYILTTKERRFALALLEHAGLAVPAERVFGLEAGSKVALLRALGRRPELAGATWHFVEDRLKTLAEVAAAPDLTGVRRYLATWGYCTTAEQATAAATPGVRCLDLAAFAAL